MDMNFVGFWNSNWNSEFPDFHFFNSLRLGLRAKGGGGGSFLVWWVFFFVLQLPYVLARSFLVSFKDASQADLVSRMEHWYNARDTAIVCCAFKLLREAKRCCSKVNSLWSMT